MPFQLLNSNGVADYLHLTLEDVEQRVKDREIPFEKRGNRTVFHKRQIEEWASPRIMSMPPEKLAAYHGKSTRHTRVFLKNEAILPRMLELGAVATDLPSRTKASVLSDLVALAGSTGNVCDPKMLLSGVKAREDLCSTAVPGGFALPHSRLHEAYLFTNSFMVVGRTVQEIHFGSPDGEPTHLFFLICCQEDRLHLHALARVCVMAKKAGVIEKLLQLPDAAAMREFLIATEQEVLEEWKIHSQSKS